MHPWHSVHPYRPGIIIKSHQTSKNPQTTQDGNTPSHTCDNSNNNGNSNSFNNKINNNTNSNPSLWPLPPRPEPPLPPRFNPEIYKLSDLTPSNPTNYILNRLKPEPPPKSRTSTGEASKTTTTAIVTRVVREVDPELYHLMGLPSFKTKSLAPPRKVGSRTVRNLAASVSAALSLGSTLATPFLQSTTHGSALYVSVDGVLQTLHSTSLGGCTRTDCIVALDSEDSLGVSWYKFVLAEGGTPICEVEGEEGGKVETLYSLR